MNRRKFLGSVLSLFLGGTAALKGVTYRKPQQIARIQDKSWHGRGRRIKLRWEQPPTPGNLLVACVTSDMPVKPPNGWSLAASNEKAGVYYKMAPSRPQTSETFEFLDKGSVPQGVTLVEFGGVSCKPSDSWQPDSPQQSKPAGDSASLLTYCSETGGNRQ